MSTPLEPISNYETIKTLHDRLKADTNNKHIMFSPNPRYGVVKFVGKADQNHRVVTAKEEWTHISFDESNTPTPISVILNVLKPLIEVHGSKPVLYCLELIIRPNDDGCHKIVAKHGFSFFQTDMNPYQKFSLEYAKVCQVLGKETDIIHSWLSKKCPKDVEIFMVGAKIYIGVNDLLAFYPALHSYNWRSLFFKQDPITPSIHICKLNEQKFMLVTSRSMSQKFITQVVKVLESAEIPESQAKVPVLVDEDDEDEDDDDSDSDDE